MAPWNTSQPSFYAPLNPVDMGQDTESAEAEQRPHAIDAIANLTVVDHPAGRLDAVAAFKIDPAESNGSKATEAIEVKVPKESAPGIARKMMKRSNNDDNEMDEASRRSERSESPTPPSPPAADSEAAANQDASRLGEFAESVTSRAGTGFRPINQPNPVLISPPSEIPSFVSLVDKAKVNRAQLKVQRPATNPATKAARYQPSRIGRRAVESSQYVTPYESKDLDKLQNDVAIRIGALAPDGKIWSESSFDRSISVPDTIITPNSGDINMDDTGEAVDSAHADQAMTDNDEEGIARVNPVTSNHKRAHSQARESVPRKQSRRSAHTRVASADNGHAIVFDHPQPQPAPGRHRGNSATQQASRHATPPPGAREPVHGPSDNRNRAPPRGVFPLRPGQASFAPHRADLHQQIANTGPAVSQLFGNGPQDSIARVPLTFGPHGIYEPDPDLWSEMQDEVLREIILNVFDEGFATQCAERPGMTVEILRTMLTILVTNRGLTVNGILHGTAPTHPATVSLAYAHQVRQAAMIYSQQLVGLGVHNPLPRRNVAGQLMYTAYGDPRLAQHGMHGHPVGPVPYRPGAAGLQTSLDSYELYNRRRAAEIREQQENAPRGV